MRYIEYSTAAREAVNRKTDEFLEQQLLKIEANVDSLQDIIDQQREEAKVLDLTRNEHGLLSGAGASWKPNAKNCG